MDNITASVATPDCSNPKVQESLSSSTTTSPACHTRTDAFGDLQTYLPRVPNTTPTHMKELDEDEDERDGEILENSTGEAGAAQTAGLDMHQLVSDITSMIGDLHPLANVKTKRGKGLPGRKIESLTSSIARDIDKAHVKRWKYMIISQKKAVEYVCKGEIIELYKVVQQNFKDMVLTPLWTTFEGLPVLVCYNTSPDEPSDRPTGSLRGGFQLRCDRE